MINYNDMSFNDTKTWDLICAGNTVGVFQLESNVGKKYAKEVAPRNIEELSQLIAVIRPGVLQAKMEDGRGLIEHYIARKHGREQVWYIHPDLRPILENSYGILVFQEQAIKIGQVFAKMSLSDADTYIRYAIGKKKTHLIDKGKVIFIDGCVKNGISKDVAEQIFSWIEAGQRYSFNASHSQAFAQHAYLSAYLKANHTKEFFSVYLKNAKHRLKPKEEVRRLVQNARSNNIKIFGPDIRYSASEFEIVDDKIRTGLTDIKTLGKTHYKNFREYLDSNPIPKTFYDYLTDMSQVFKKGNINLINAGALDFYGIERQEMVYLWDIWSRLTDLEKKTIKSKLFHNVQDALLYIYNRVNSRRKQAITDLINALDNPPYKLKYNTEQIEKLEIDLIGAPLTCTRLRDNPLKAVANINASQYNQGHKKKDLLMVGIISHLKVIKTKNGDEMCFISLEDDTGLAEDLVCFPNVYQEYKHNIVEELVVLVSGSRDWKTNNLIITEVIEI